MRLMMMRIDSSGKESRTLFFVTVSWAAILFKFVLAGVTLPIFGRMPEMSPTEFGTSIAFILGIWLGREWIKSEPPKKE